MNNSNINLSIISKVCDITLEHFIIEWYGGSKLTIDRLKTKGDWDKLIINQWIHVDILRKTTGEIILVSLIDIVEEPQGFSQKQLNESYSAIPAANLDAII